MRTKELECEIMGSENRQFPDLHPVAGPKLTPRPKTITVAIWKELGDEGERGPIDVTVNATPLEALKVCSRLKWILHISDSYEGLYAVSVPEEVMKKFKSDGYIEKEVEIDGERFGIDAEWPD